MAAIEIVPFVECKDCGRNFGLDTNFWHDIENRICICCKCKGDEEEKDILTCKESSCKYHDYLYRDFINENAEDKKQAAKRERRKDEIEVLNEAQKTDDNTCRICKISLDAEFYFCNMKYTNIDLKGDTQQNTKRVKVKFCKACFEREFLRLING